MNTPPFAWQDKRILRRIREQCEDYGSALSTYIALTVAASDVGKNEFQTTHTWLAQLSGMSDRTIRRRLEDLRRIGVIEIITPKLRAPSTYRLLAIGHNGRTTGHKVRTFGQAEAISWPRSEEKNKEKEGRSDFKLGTLNFNSMREEIL